MILDSNIIIYLSKPEYLDRLIHFLQPSAYVSIVTHIEVLGYHQLAQDEHEELNEILSILKTLPLSDVVVTGAIELKQQRKMGLGDAIVASTALTINLPLITRNTKDFAWIEGLQVINPFNDDNVI